MAKLTDPEITEVNSLDDTALFYAVDQTRATGDQDTRITKANLKTELASDTPTLQEVTTQGATTTDLTTFNSGIGLGNSSTVSADGTEAVISHPINVVVEKGGAITTIITDAGNWNASTNSPTLANTDTDRQGVEYKVTTAGSVDFGAGSITFAIGDIVANDGTIWYKKVDNNQSGGGSVSLPWIDITDSPYNAVADALGDAGVDSTSAFNDALDALETAGGGILYIPYTNGTRFNITPITATTRDYSNITITSFGTGRIFVKDIISGTASPSRGVLINIGANTDNFKIENLDILVSDGAFRNDFENGVICSQAGNLSNITIDNVKIANESKLDTAIGVDGITFYRDVTDGLDTGTLTNLTIKNCDIRLYGNKCYGIQILRKSLYTEIKENTLELFAHTVDTDDAFNAIALYGDSEFFNITRNKVLSSGHSGIASSMSRNGVIAYNYVKDVNISDEGGIEIEYKASHGSESEASNGVKVYGNTIDNCTHGIIVREDGDGATTLAPYNLLIHGNTITNSDENDILIASSTGGSSDYTSQLKNIIVSENYLESTASRAGISVYDAADFKLIDNIIKGGQNRGIVLGRSSGIYVSGQADIIGNDIYSPIADGIYIESTQANFRMDRNNVYNPGVRGFWLFTIQGGENWHITNNYVNNAASDGFLFSAGRTILLGSVITGNRSYSCGGRGFQFRFDDSLIANNVSKDCTTSDNIESTGGTIANNLDL